MSLTFPMFPRSTNGTFLLFLLENLSEKKNEEIFLIVRLINFIICTERVSNSNFFRYFNELALFFTVMRMCLFARFTTNLLPFFLPVVLFNTFIIYLSVSSSFFFQATNLYDFSREMDIVVVSFHSKQ